MALLRRQCRSSSVEGIPLSECVELLDISPTDFTCAGSEMRPSPEGDYSGYKYVVVEIDEAEADKDWKPGIYAVRMPPHDVYARIHPTSTSSRS